MSRAVSFSLALAFDLGFGELPAAGHPVVVGGWVIARVAGKPTGRAGRDLTRGALALALPTAGAWAVGLVVERRTKGIVRIALVAWLALVPLVFLLWQSFLTPETATNIAEYRTMRWW